jgi:hypothetical protein
VLAEQLAVILLGVCLGGLGWFASAAAWFGLCALWGLALRWVRR